MMTPERRAEIMHNAEGRRNDLHRLQEAGLICKSGDFSPLVHYPQITRYDPIDQEEMFKGYTLPPDELFDVYAHIPFCEKRCVFCHYPLKLGKAQEAEKDKYLAALEKEMDIYMAQLGIDKIKTRSILVGGGTPTYLTLKQLEHFLKFFTSRLDLSQLTQFNYDLDPGSMIGEEGLAKLHLMKDYGVDRLTIGVQSLNDDILRKMNRAHDSAEAKEAIKNSLEMGFITNIEFIFGYPWQTNDNWIEVMEEAVTLAVEEIQLYRLKIDAYGDYQGPIDRLIQKNPQVVPTLDESLMMKQIAIDILNDAGYTENLRRVFSRKREHYSHYADNQCCQLRDEIGFGISTFSSLRDRFVLTTPSFDEYYDKIASGKLPLNRGLVRSHDEQCRWALMLPLKNRDVYKPTYIERTGGPVEGKFQAEIDKLIEHGLVEETDDIIRLTKEGCFFADEVVEHFQSSHYLAFPKEEYALGPLTPMGAVDEATLGATLQAAG